MSRATAPAATGTASVPAALPLRLAWALAWALAALPAPARAQYDPHFRWSTLDTPHFQIHFHQGEEALSQRVAREAERAHARLTPLLGYAPAERTQIVLSDDVDDANGSATPLPYDLIRLFAVPPESGSVLNDARDWVEQLVSHEYVHILHLDHVEGVPRVLNGIFGKLFVPNGLTPGWMIEGIAVRHEAMGDPSTGRNESALFDMYARALTVEPPGLPSLAQASNQFLRWPRGNVPYLLGGRFMAFVEARAAARGGSAEDGTRAMAAFLADQGAQLWPYAPSWQAERWFGADLPTLWDEFKASLEVRYAGQLARVRARPVTRATPLTHRGALVQHPRWTPDGLALVYLDRGLDERAGLRRVTAAGRDLGRLVPVDANGAFDLRSAREAVVSKTQVWREHRTYDDLYVVDLATGAERRLTDGERATDPALTGDGSAVVYSVHTGGGETALRRRLLSGGPAETLLSRPGAELYQPVPSPDGRRIAFSLQEGGRRDLALLQDGQVIRLTDDDALDLDPAWTPDGRFLLFASDRGGIYNLHAWEAETGDLRQVTNVETGAFEPAVSPDGKTIAFVTYSRAGHDLAAIPFDRASWLDPAPAAPAPPPRAAAAVPDLPVRPYSPGETARPTFLLPTWGADASGPTYGVFTGGSDAVGRHTWLAQGWLSWDASTAGYAATYQGGWSWPSLDLLSQRFLDWSPGLPSRVVALWTPLAGGATFTFTSLQRALAFRVGWSATFYDSLDAPRFSPDLPPASLFRDGLLSEASFGVSYGDARRYASSISTEEGRSLSLRARVASPATGSDYELWRARAAWAEYLRVPGTRHAVLATRLSGALAHGSLGGSPPYSLGGISSQPSVIDLFLLQSFAPSDQLRGYPAGLFGGNGVALLNLELRFPLLEPELGRSTWPVFLRRVHGALFVDAGETFVAGHERGYTGRGFDWDRLRVGAGAELRLETVVGYWLVADLRLGVARGLGRPFGNVSPTQDPFAEWQFYATYGPSF